MPRLAPELLQQKAVFLQLRRGPEKRFEGLQPAQEADEGDFGGGSPGPRFLQPLQLSLRLRMGRVSGVGQLAVVEEPVLKQSDGLGLRQVAAAAAGRVLRVRGPVFEGGEPGLQSRHILREAGAVEGLVK